MVPDFGNKVELFIYNSFNKPVVLITFTGVVAAVLQVPKGTLPEVAAKSA